MSNFLDGNRPADAPLSGFLADAGDGEDRLVAGMAPTVDVSSKDFKGTVWSLPLAAMLGAGDHIGTGKLLRGERAKFPEPFNDYTFTETSYQCRERSFVDYIDRVTLARFAGPLAPVRAEQFRAKTGRMTLLLDFEAEVIANTVFNTGNWTNVAIGGLGGQSAQLAWTSAASTPLVDGRRLINLIRTATGGLKPDYGYITYAAVDACTNHKDFTGHVGTYAQGLAQGSALVTHAQVIERMKAAWNLDDLFVVESMYNSANPGQALSVSEIEAGGQLWLGCKRGMRGAGGSVEGIQNGAMIVNGPVSFVVLREDLAMSMPDTMAAVPRRGFFGLKWQENNPPLKAMAMGHSFAVVRPSDMSGSAYLLTGLT